MPSSRASTRLSVDTKKGDCLVNHISLSKTNIYRWS